jgi:hypothetical protein
MFDAPNPAKWPLAPAKAVPLILDVVVAHDPAVVVVSPVNAGN